MPLLRLRSILSLYNIVEPPSKNCYNLPGWFFVHILDKKGKWRRCFIIRFKLWKFLWNKWIKNGYKKILFWHHKVNFFVKYIERILCTIVFVGYTNKGFWMIDGQKIQKMYMECTRKGLYCKKIYMIFFYILH